MSEITLRIRLDGLVSARALADELALHIAPLIAQHTSCGDLMIGGVQGDWSLEER